MGCSTSNQASKKIDIVDNNISWETIQNNHYDSILNSSQDHYESSVTISHIKQKSNDILTFEIKGIFIQNNIINK
ncbi:unnamed protein product [Paramecium sonneborni]|uniref:Uncharacterized protein n=1 Tax=Paramecium sonneborni TaxID=65129 RepID=A0A8S1MYJ4_9CILI|nr:unnamed protein product [Paramecium sonneborni]